MKNNHYWAVLLFLLVGAIISIQIVCLGAENGFIFEPITDQRVSSSPILQSQDFVSLGLEAPERLNKVNKLVRQKILENPKYNYEIISGEENRLVRSGNVGVIKAEEFNLNKRNYNVYIKHSENGFIVKLNDYRITGGEVYNPDVAGTLKGFLQETYRDIERMKAALNSKTVPEILITFVGRANLQDKYTIQKGLPIRLVNRVTKIGTMGKEMYKAIVTKPEAEVSELVEELRRKEITDGVIENKSVNLSASKDSRKVSPQETPNDDYFNENWGLQQINAPDAWDLEQGSSSVRVAVIDSGTDLDHPDLDDNTSKSLGKDFACDGYVERATVCPLVPPSNGNPNEAVDHVSHGTFVSGIIGAEGNNGQGVSGVSWEVEMFPIRIFSEAWPFGDDDLLGFLNKSADDFAQAIPYAVDNGADIINMSVGGDSQLGHNIEQLLENAYDENVILITSAGNDNTNNDYWPPVYDRNNPNLEIITVGATEDDDDRCDYTASKGSNYGDYVDVSAPGGTGMISTIVPGDNEFSNFGPQGYYGGRHSSDGGNLWGTSWAAPFVSGVAALYLAEGGSADGFYDLIENHLSEIGEPADSPFINSDFPNRINAYWPLLRFSLSIENNPSRHEIAEGDEFIFSFQVRNQSGNQIENVIIGASIVDKNEEYCSDPDHDKLVSIPEARAVAPKSTLKRQFDTGDTTCGKLGIGEYDLEFALWDDANENEKIDESDFKIVSKKVENVVQIQPAAGSLEVTIKPSEARDAGAQWRVQDSAGNWSNWFDSGHTETDLPVGNYTVKYKDISGWSTPSNDSGKISGNQTSNESGTYKLTPPDSPGNLSASTSSSSQINLSWSDNSGNEDGFKIYRGGNRIDTVGSNTESYHDTGLNSDTQYCYRVSAYNSAGESSRSNQDCATTSRTAPDAPGNLNVNATSTSRVNLNWSDNSGNESGFRIYREGSRIDSAGSNNTSYSDTGLNSDTEYCYQVSAYNSAGESSKTSQACATTTPAGPNCKVEGASNKPRDQNGNGLYEDVNGNGRLDFDDAVTLFQGYMGNDSCASNNERYFDLNDNGRLDSDDAVKLVGKVVSSSMQRKISTSEKGLQSFTKFTYNVVPTVVERKTIKEGETPVRKLDVYLTGLSQGLSGYLIGLNPDEGIEIKDITPGAFTATFEKESRSRSNRISIRAADLQNEVTPEVGEVKLATFEVTFNGRSDLVIEPIVLDNDFGSPLKDSQTQLEVKARSGEFPQINQVFVSPNPVNEGPVTFEVKGKTIEKFKVEVFNAAGKSVHETGFIPATEDKTQLSWDLTDTSGRKVSSGIYLYTLAVKGPTGETVQLAVRKLLVLR